ncbi:MAG: tripartite tricarboxylate transporter substrate binding protein [Betaproteobacteria bacterium]
MRLNFRSNCQKLFLLALTSASLFGLILPSQYALAQTAAFPSKPVKLITPYPAGGSSDLMGRVIGQKLSVAWNQAVVIENKPGAAGSIGMEYAKQQPNDGYAFVIGNMGPAGVNPLLSKVHYDMDKDFIAVGLIATGPNVLVVSENSPYKTLADLIAAAKANPGKISFGSSGPGSLSHLSTEMLMRQAGVTLIHVPYKGGGLAINDVLAGHIDMIISDGLPAAQFIKANKLRPLAITSAKRNNLFPGVPTFAEAGVQGLVALNWWGVFLPAGTPKPIVDQYQSTFMKVMNDPEVKKQINNLDVDATMTSQEEFKTFIESEKVFYSKLIRDNNIKGD